MVRGNRVHKGIEDYLTNNGDLPVEALSLAESYDGLRSSNLLIEDEWGFTKDWQVTSWNAEDVALRMKLDALSVNGNQCLIVDHKTGKPSPIKHASQGQLYAVGTAIRYPEIEELRVEFWYVDQGTKSSVSYKRQQTERFKESFDRRINKVWNDQVFKPINNKSNCRFCSYGENGNKQCQYRYAE